MKSLKIRAEKATGPQSTGQRGFVLVAGMLFLIVLTILVISLMRTSILEERMAGYSRDWNVAFQSAESALRDAEREILVGTRIIGETDFSSGCSATGLCRPNLCTDSSATGDCLPIWIDLEKKQADTGWIKGATGGKSVTYGHFTSATTLTGVGAQPRYIIEVLTVPDANSLKIVPGQPAQKYLYRATAVGFGASVNTRVMLQGTYRQ